MLSKRVAVWLFTCPECGFGHAELGHLAADDDIYCVVCHEEEGRNVTLTRWLRAAPRGRVVEPRPASKPRKAA